MKLEDVPSWLDDFVGNVADAYEMWNPTAHAIGWQWSQEDGAFEVVVYPNLVEVEGEPCLPSDIHIEVSQILDLFERRTHLSMAINCSNDDYLSIEGHVKGHNVWLRLLNWPPEGDDEPTSRLHADGSFEEIEPGVAANSNKVLR